MEPTIPLFPDQASTVASRVDNLYFFMIAVSAFFAVAVTLMVVFFAIKYRRRHDDEVGEPIHGSLALELLWTGIPFVIAMVMFVWGSSVYFALARVPEEALDIYAVGKQWMWKFQHREGQREINELHVPVNTPRAHDHHLGRRAARPVLPVVPREDRRHSRPLHAGVVQRHQDRHATTSSARSTAARSTRA